MTADRRRGALILFAGLAAALLMFELLFRVISAGRVMVHPTLGWIAEPGEIRELQFEGGAISHWGELGTRVGPPVTGNPPVILVLGDSFTEAKNVGDDVVYTARLQRALTGQQIPVRVLNCGRAGLSPADYVGLSSQYLRLFKPAWVVVQLNRRDLDEDALYAVKTHFVHRGGRLEVVTVLPKFGQVSRILQQIRRHCLLINAAFIKMYRYGVGSHLPPLFRAGDRPAAGASRGSPASPAPVELELDALRGAYGGRLTILFGPEFCESRPSSPESRLFAWCRSNHASCVNLRSSFAQFHAGGTAPSGFSNSSFGEGHWNEEGHAAASRILVAELEGLHARGLF